MPFKDPEKYKEWNRNRMRKKRAAEKAEREMQTIVVCNQTGNCKTTFVIPKVLSPEEQESFNNVKGIIESSGDLQMKEIIEEFKKVYEPKPKKSFKDALSFIPNLLSMHLDLKMLKQCGGTA